MTRFSALRRSSSGASAFLLYCLALAATACGEGDSRTPEAVAPGVIPPDPPRETACTDGDDNDDDGFSDCDDLDCRAGSDACALAPPLDRSVVTTLADAATFLYTGKDPIQKEVDPKVFDKRRVAIVRGRALGPNGEPLGFVRVSVLGHPEYGYSLSRADGAFDLAVNGGGRLVLHYEKTGYVEVQRAVTTAWQRYSLAGDARLVAESATATRVRSGAESMQIARAEAVTDAHGMRQPTVLIRPDTSAAAILADKRVEPLSEWHVRITELTGDAAEVGTAGDASRLSHTVEFSVDEAATQGALRVDFSKPVVSLVENFAGLPVGTELPNVYYDRAKGEWQYLTPGRVLAILDEQNGRAVLDTDGDGSADPEELLAALGIDDAELAALADSYDAGASLWRRELAHFSPFSIDLPVQPPAGAAPFSPPAGFGSRLDVPTVRGDLLVEPAASQQTVGLVGTPLALHYQSTRTPAALGDYQIRLPLLGELVPEGLLSIRADVDVAGRRHTVELDAEPDATLEYTWDGRDVYGRPVQGEQLATVTVEYRYRGALAGSGGERFSIGWEPPPAVLRRSFDVPLGTWDATGYGLGGFSLTNLHAFDPARGVVYFGDGTTRRPEQGARVITPAASNALAVADSVAIAADGSVLVTDDQGRRILRVHPDGTETSLVGRGARGEAAELVPSSPQGILERDDGSVVFADFGVSRIYEVSPSGDVTLLVGDTSSAVVDYRLTDLDGIALGPDGAFYIAEDDVVLRYSGGTMSVVAGGGDNEGTFFDGVPATSVRLRSPSGTTVGPDGTLYFTERRGHRIHAVSPGGTLRTIAGTGEAGFSGDGGPARAAELDNPRGLAFAPDGTIYFADQANDRVRAVTPSGLIVTIGGGGDGDAHDALVPTAVELDAPDGVALSPDGTLYVATAGGLFRIGKPTGAGTFTETVVPADDGRIAYRFDGQGRHLATIDTLTGTALWTFTYGAASQLVTATDRDGLSTSFERDSDGVLEAVVGPYGARNEIAIDAGRLVRLTDPIGRAAQFIYQGDTFLLSDSIDPTNQTRHFDYDALGQVTRIADADGYTENVARTPTGSSADITVTTGAGRPTQYAIRFDAGITARSAALGDTDPVETVETDLGVTTTWPDGTELVAFKAPDLRWGGTIAPLGDTILTTPAGRSLVVYRQRQTHTENASDPLSVTAEDEWLEIDGRVAQATYDVATRTRTVTSPLGRTSKVRADERGRPVSILAAGAPALAFEYDSHGRLAEAVAAADGIERRTVFSYGTDGLLSTTTDAAGHTATIQRDGAGRATSNRRPDGHSVSWTLDETSRLTALTPAGSEPHRFHYTDDKLLRSYDPPDVAGTPQAGMIQYRYTEDGDRDLERIDLLEDRGVAFTYDDSTGRLSKITVEAPENEYAIDYGYDAVTGALERLSGPDSTITYRTDGPLLTAITTTGVAPGTVTFDYDASFRVASVALDGDSLEYTYDDDGLVTSAGSLAIDRNTETGHVESTHLGAVQTGEALNGFGELEAHLAITGHADLFQQVYDRDALGRIVHLEEIVDGDLRTLDFEYDALGQLVRVTDDVSDTEYEYDLNGNRLSASENGVITSGSYDAQDRLVSYGAWSYAQTASGDLLRKTDGTRAVTYGYDPLGSLRSVAREGFASGPARVDYKVDALGRRIEKRNDGALVSQWLYAGGLAPIAQIDADGTTTRFVYARAAHVPDYFVRDGARYRLIRDHVESVRLVVDAETGSVAQRIDYDAFGQVLRDTNPGFQPFGFAGGIYDAETGLVQFGARDYDAETGRWTAKDPIMFAGGSGNVYSYAHNDPVNYIDLSGLKEKSVKDRAIDVVAALAEGLICTVLGCGAANAPGHKEATIPATSEGEKMLVSATLGLRPLAPMGKALRATAPVAARGAGRGFAEIASASRAGIAQRIAQGHAFEKHVLKQAEFAGIRTRAQFAQIVEEVLANPTHVRELAGGRSAFFNQQSGVLVIVNPKAADYGTVFAPVDGLKYFLNLK